MKIKFTANDLANEFSVSIKDEKITMTSFYWIAGVIFLARANETSQRIRTNTIISTWFLFTFVYVYITNKFEKHEYLYFLYFNSTKKIKKKKSNNAIDLTTKNKSRNIVPKQYNIIINRYIPKV